MQFEIEYLMSLSESGVRVMQGAAADLNKVAEWLDTPRGSVYGLPSWGNELKQFQHEPTNSSDTAVNIEFHIINGLTRDIPEIVIQSIFCEPHPVEPDRFLITIGLPSGELSKDI
ncbi:MULTISPECIES: hypothetical protein [Shewanella]|uniref:hypothetical protein n=1 Tax=Shewanella TaxID=22 RepID=UPI001AAE3355|nr:hypothetical protein [Shewanella algae]MBO2580291.1 hypothetical protein [Shewanella algae]HDS1207877.1 hypothetical protein [Shewanella algae]